MYFRLPVDTATGQSLSASASCSGSKKEAQVACALNACHILGIFIKVFFSESMVINWWFIPSRVHSSSEVFICIILDAQGVLYRRSNVRRRKERDLEENDFYDSDEDTFFDRTGQIEKSRENRRKRALVRRLSKN